MIFGLRVLNALKVVLNKFSIVKSFLDLKCALEVYFAAFIPQFNREANGCLSCQIGHQVRL